MNVECDADHDVSTIASAIGEPARARMLFCLLDNRARTGTELAVVAGVSPSTASVHLNRLRAESLVRMRVQGKHRYFTLAGPAVATVLEGLSVLAGGVRDNFVPNTPNRLRAARTCYDHIAGELGVALSDRLEALAWLESVEDDYVVTGKGTKAFERLAIDVEGARALRRRFAFGCVDWSERRPHIGGALGAALLHLALDRKWVTQDLDSRALSITRLGRREMERHFGLRL